MCHSDLATAGPVREYAAWISLLKTALVYDWLVTVGGGEKTLDAIYECFPAPIHTLVNDRKAMANTVMAEAEVHSSFFTENPFCHLLLSLFAPLVPLCNRAVRSKGIRTDPLNFSRRRQRRFNPCRATAPLLLSHPDALCLGPDASLLGRFRACAKSPCSHRTAPAEELGHRFIEPRRSFRCDFPLYR